MLEVLVNIHIKALYRTFAKGDMRYIWIVRELMLKRGNNMKGLMSSSFPYIIHCESNTIPKKISKEKVFKINANIKKVRKQEWSLAN